MAASGKLSMADRRKRWAERFHGAPIFAKDPR